jgi:hypothetical protein
MNIVNIHRHCIDIHIGTKLTNKFITNYGTDLFSIWLYLL